VNDSFCNLMSVTMIVHTAPCSLLPHLGKKSSDYVRHEQPESWEAMLSFSEQFDAANSIKLDVALQLAGVGVKVSDIIGHEDTEIVDVDGDGVLTVIASIQFTMPFHAEQVSYS
jgi:hypothetical protein